MTSDIKIVDNAKKQLSMHPKKFGLWLFIVTVVMIFASLTSAYIVRQAEGNWFVFELPWQLWVTTGLIAVSSISMHWAYIAAKRDNLESIKIAISITVLLAVLFLVGQLYIWGLLVDENVFLVGNPSGSFLYILSGLHGLHIVSGIIFLIIVLNSTFKYKTHSKNLAQIEMCTTYWHFLGGLWIYLFIFLLLNH